MELEIRCSCIGMAAPVPLPLDDSPPWNVSYGPFIKEWDLLHSLENVVPQTQCSDPWVLPCGGNGDGIPLLLHGMAAPVPLDDNSGDCSCSIDDDLTSTVYV